MDGINDDDVYIEDSRKEFRYFFAVAWGVLMGGLTLAVQSIALLSANPIVAAIQFSLTALLIPGLVCAAMIGSLAVGAVINGFFHLGVSWILLTLFA
jgi:hypothetical protein